MNDAKILKLLRISLQKNRKQTRFRAYVRYGLFFLIILSFFLYAYDIIKDVKLAFYCIIYFQLLILTYGMWGRE